jgi:hypothetical protein
MPTHHPHLYTAELKALRPTQMTVGMAEVQDKARLWVDMPKKQRHKFLQSHWFPAVLGPKRHFYIVDHHHLGRALLDEGETHCQIVLLKDLSELTPDEFWVVMDHHQWQHTYDAKGRRCPARELPKRLDELTDDPYRSLAAAVRRAGGFPKDATPFSEFLWADFFRRRVPVREVKSDLAAAVQAALPWCHSAAAAHLPGWSGDAQPLAQG